MTAPWDADYQETEHAALLRKRQERRQKTARNPALLTREDLETDDELRGVVAVELGRMVARDIAKNVFDETRNPPEPVRLMTEADLHNLPSVEWWIEGIVPRGADVEIAAPGGVGKSFLALHMARCVASGMPFFQRPARTGKTLYVLGEGLSGFGQRVRAWDEYFKSAFVPADSITYMPGGVNLSQRSSVQRLREVFRDGGYDLLVIDTLSKLGGVSNENDPAQVKDALLAVQSIRELKEGASSIVIHHTDAAGKKARGASPIRDNVDVLWMLKPYSSGFTMSSLEGDGGKMKDAAGERIEGFELQSVGDSAVVVQSGKAPVSPFWGLISSALADGQFHTGTELREACGITASSGRDYDSFKRQVQRWTEDGLLAKDPDASATRPRYRLTPILGEGIKPEKRRELAGQLP